MWKMTAPKRDVFWSCEEVGVAENINHLTNLYKMGLVSFCFKSYPHIR